jgi:hypothetical protein
MADAPTPFLSRQIAGGVTVGGLVQGIGAAVTGYIAYRASTGINGPTSSVRNEGSITFPTDLIAPESNRNYYMSFRFSKYRRRSIFERTAFTPTGASLILPIPNNLTDTQAVSWGDSDSSNNALVGAGIESALKGLNNNAGGIEGAIGVASTMLAPAAAGLALNQADKAASTTGIPIDQVLQMAGVAQNPFLTLLFKSPAFKTHTFSWKLSPNNVPESEKLRDIISMFRRHMLPAIAPSTGGTLLTYPDIVEINLFPNENFLYKFKPCVVESMSVNFAPNAGPSFFKNSNAPTEIQLSVNLKEIEYWLQDDVDDFYSASNLSRQI